MSRATILAIWVALTAHFSVSLNALHLPSNALSLRNSENRIKIDLIDVKCDKNENGMHVTIQFSQPFEGIIYSQGFFNDPKCRYVSAGEGDQSYNFVVPFEGCGSKPSCAICDSVDNVLIIQQDEEVQGEFDAARKISCSRTGVEEEKKVYFKPFIVQSLDVITVPTKHGGVDCWMDIQRGIYPKLTPIGEVIKIGEELTVIVYLRDPKNEYDLTVRNCWAYDTEDFDDKKTGKVQLSDSSGCTMKRKLFGSWHKTDETGSSGATLLLHNTLRAFKFPDESQVYLKCDIEICHGNCAEAICDADEINKVDCTLDPLNEKCIRDKIVDRTVNNIGITTIANNIRQPSSTSKVTNRVPFIENTGRPSFVFTTTQRPSYISTTILDEETTTLRPFICHPGSQDIRCIQPQYTNNADEYEATTLRETTTYQNLFKTTTIKPGYESFCSLYPKHKRCNQRVTDDFNSNLEILTFKPPSPFATVKYQPTTDIPSRNLEYVSTTETAAITEQPLNCKGPYLDPRCPNPTPTGTPPTYLPPGTTKKIITQTFAPRCYPGSLDSRCPKIDISTQTAIRPTTIQPITKTTTKKFFICPEADDVNCDEESSKLTEAPPVEKTTIPSRNQYGTTKQPEKPICFLGSTNPECQKISTQILTFKPQPTTTSIPPTTTTTEPFVNTSRTPICYPGSLDSRCVKPTRVSFGTDPSLPSKPLIYSTPEISSTTSAPNCYPGSANPQCSQSTTRRVPGSFGTTRPPVYFTPSIPSTTRTPICYPGSPDQRCQKQITTKKIVPEVTPVQKIDITEITTYTPTTIGTPICYLGSQDPRCRQEITTRKTIPEIKTTQKVITDTRGPVCYPGALDPRCQKPTTAKPFISSISTTQKVVSEQPTTKSTRCYPGSLDPQCVQSTTKRIFVSFGTATPAIPSITRTPICYPGTLDPRCRPSTTEKTFINTTKQTPTVNVISTTIKPPTYSTTQTPVRCYPGSLDPRCSSKQLVVPLQCGPGSIDPRCPNPTPTAEPATYLPPKPTIIYKTQRPPITTTTEGPIICTFNILDPRCKSVTSPTFISRVTTDGSIVTFSPETTTKYLPPVTTTFTQRPTYTTTTRPPYSFPTFTTKPPIRISSTIPPLICTPNSLDPRCEIDTTSKFIPSVTTDGTITTFSPETTPKVVPTTIITQRPTYTPSTRPPFSFPQFTTRPPVRISTTYPPFVCTPSNSLDPRCRTNTPRYVPTVTTDGSIVTFSPETTTKYLPPVTTTFTQRPTYTTTTRPPYSFPTFTTKPPIRISTTIPPLICTPKSFDPRCKIVTTESPTPTVTYIPETTQKVIPISTTTTTTTTTQRPTYTTTTRPPFSFPTFSTRRIISSPQPFVTRPTNKPTSTTTENILCYPGSTIEGCKQTITTPSYCFPGSKDPRCPQLPPSFSTRQPPTYLPPFIDVKLNRVRRQTLVENEHEIVKFSLSFKPFNFS